MAGKNGKGKLTEEQRLALLAWLAEGLTTNEVNSLAASFEPPFKVTPQGVYGYRRTYDLELQTLRTERDGIAISTGLALRAKRIEALINLATLLEEDLRVKHLVWTNNKKMVGEETYDFKEFNEAEIRQLRGIYDDLARETGGRITRTDITSLGKQVKGYVMVNPDDWPDKPQDKSK